MGSVRVTSRVIPWSNKEVSRYDRGMLEAATDIDRTSAILAPKLTRALVKSRQIIRKGVAHYAVRYGNTQVPYARIQHEGGVIKPKHANMLAWQTDGVWHFAHSVTIKGTHYLERAGDAVSRNITKYFK